MSANNQNLLCRKGVWYVNVRTVDGPIRRSLQTKDVAVARARRDIFLDELSRNAWDAIEKKAAKAGEGHATVRQLIEAYYAWAESLECQGRPRNMRTLRQNVSSALCVLRARFPHLPSPYGDRLPSELDSITLLEFDKDLPEEYATSFMQAAKEKKRRKSSTAVSLFSNLKFARCLFSDVAPPGGGLSPAEFYEDWGLVLPDCCKQFARRTKRLQASPPSYQRPPEELVMPTLRAGRDLKASRPDLHLAFLLTYDLGLRTGEAVHAKWTWFRGRPNGEVEVTIQSDGLAVGEEGWDGPKHSTTARPGRTIAITRSVFNDLRDYWRDGAVYLVPGATATDRRKLFNEKLNPWMRQLGWTKEAGYEKAGYELRKLRGSEYYAKLGAEQAKNFLGHASVVTTEEFYAALGRRQVKALEPERLPEDISFLDNALFELEGAA